MFLKLYSDAPRPLGSTQDLYPSCLPIVALMGNRSVRESGTVQDRSRGAIWHLPVPKERGIEQTDSQAGENGNCKVLKGCSPYDIWRVMVLDQPPVENKLQTTVIKQLCR